MCRIRSLTRRQKHPPSAIPASISSQQSTAINFSFFLAFFPHFFSLISGVCPGLRCFPSKHSGARAAEARVHCGSVTSRVFFFFFLFPPELVFCISQGSFTSINRHFINQPINPGVLELVFNNFISTYCPAFFFVCKSFCRFHGNMHRNIVA